MSRRFTDKQKADCAKRELGKRRWVYPRSVAAGRMSQEICDKEIGLMEEIEAEYRAKAEDEEAEGRLF